MNNSEADRIKITTCKDCGKVITEFQIWCRECFIERRKTGTINDELPQPIAGGELRPFYPNIT